MKLLREQWRGLGIACDLALVTGDKDMAAAVWRNLLGARGAQGIAYPNTAAPTLPKDEPKLDPSTGGVTDFEGAEIDNYVLYPELMLIMTAYIRRQLVRLSFISDTTILGGLGRGTRESVLGPEPGTGIDVTEAQMNLAETFKFGSVRETAKKLGMGYSEVFKDSDL